MRAKYLGLLALSAAMSVAGVSRANDFSLSQPIYADDGVTSRAPLMHLLDQAGVAKPLEDAGINIYGLVEASWTYSFDDPPGDIIAGRSFDFEHDDPTLNQIYLVVERNTDFEKAWDIGGKMAWTYGADSRFMHSNGLFDEENGNNQIDLTELYGEVVVPVGNGLKVKVGKFITPLGYEYVNPSQNAFYSHSFIFGLVPFSHTGVMATYAIDDQWSVSGGISRGWDQSLEDNNDAIDVIGSIGWVSPEGDITSALSFTVGPEKTDNNSDYRIAIDWWASYVISDQWTAAINGDFIWEENSGDDGDDASVYGIAGYLGYKVCEECTINGRIEWFNDTERLGGPDTQLFEATLGLAIRPFARHEIASNLLIRPEVRYDYADDPVFNAGEDDSQITFGVDVLFTF